jgi:Regulator of chromosome condensation (RCC1) repeat
VNGRAVGGVFVPPGSMREIVVSAFDASGAETHRGQAQREFSEMASILAPDIPVLPLAAGDPFGLQLAAQRLELERTDGERSVIQLRARVFDPDGQRLPLPVGDIRYGLKLNDPRDYKLVLLADGGIELVPLTQTATPPTQTATLCRGDVTAYACRQGVCDAVDICRDPWVAIAAGGDHSCGITRSGVAYCWGENRNGELGATTQELCGGPPHIPCGTKPTPVTCPPTAAPCRFKYIAGGQRGSCAIDTNDDLWCWGFGSTAHTRIVAQLGGARVRFTSVAVGGGHVCAISDRDELWCAGENGAGQLGLPRTTPRVALVTPQRVLVSIRFRQVVAGFTHTCGVTTDSRFGCWARMTRTSSLCRALVLRERHRRFSRNPAAFARANRSLIRSATASPLNWQRRGRVRRARD